jgi:hypothetical protein
MNHWSRKTCMGLSRMAEARVTFHWSGSGDKAKHCLPPETPCNFPGSHRRPSFSHQPPLNVDGYNGGCHVANPQGPPCSWSQTPCQVKPQTTGGSTHVVPSQIPFWKSSCLWSHGLMLCRPGGRWVAYCIAFLWSVEKTYHRCSSIVFPCCYASLDCRWRGVVCVLLIPRHTNNSWMSQNLKFWPSSLWSSLKTLKQQRLATWASAAVDASWLGMA